MSHKSQLIRMDGKLCIILDLIEQMTCLTLTVSIITVDIITYSRLKSMAEYHEVLKKYCKQLLSNQVLSSAQILNLSTSKLARAYGIDSIIIEKCKTNNNSDRGEFSEETDIVINSFHSKDFHSLKYALSRQEVDLAGLNVEVEQMVKLLKFSASNPSSYLHPVGVLFHGPPGCGKSSLAQYLAKMNDSVLIVIESSDIVQAEFGAGAENLKSLFRKAVQLTEEGTVIVFLDEIDALCPNFENASMGTKQITSALISVLDKSHEENVSGLLVIGATNFISSVESSLRRPGRFDREILIKVPSKSQRLSILKLLTKNFDLSDVCLDSIALRTVGYVGADLKALCDEVENNAYNRNTLTNNIIKVKFVDFEHGLHVVSPSMRKGLECAVDLQPVKWGDIGGLEDIKMEIKQSIEWPLFYDDALRRMDLSPTKGILLYGPPGCCKTTLVKAAASNCHVNFLSLTGAQVFSAYVGESEKIISEAFQKARALSPSILFFDEIESLVGKRSTKSNHSHVQDRILATLLNEMDGVGIRLDKKIDSSLHRTGEKKIINAQRPEDGAHSEFNEKIRSQDVDQSQVIVVGSTNRPDMIDAALMRPGRLDKLIYVPPPDALARRAILDVFISKMATSDVDNNQLSQNTEGYTGADLKNLCKEAGLLALREMISNCQESPCRKSLVVHPKHFTQALVSVKPSLTEDNVKCYK